MHRLHRKSRYWPVSLDGWLAAFVSRLNRAFFSPTDGCRRRRAKPTGLDAVRRGGPRILIADDTPSHLGEACELLACYGLTPTMATDGAEAVALACACDFDLILMDLQMPVLDGLGATKQIRRFEGEHDRLGVPVVAYTARAVDEEVMRKCGIDGVLEKPCSARARHECLLRWCVPRGSDGLGRPTTRTS
jgi:CheY-like chemotaxis protein